MLTCGECVHAKLVEEEGIVVCLLSLWKRHSREYLEMISPDNEACGSFQPRDGGGTIYSRRGVPR